MATEHTFNFIFDALISSIQRSVPDPKKIRPFVEQLKAKKRALYQNYNGIKEDIKAKCMKTPEGFLDRHKCAAAFMIAALNTLDMKEKKLNKEKIAVIIGLLILKIFIEGENKNFSECAILAHLENSGFTYPQCICDEEPYKYSWMLGMHYDRITNRLSVLSLANTLFWIERWNRTESEQVK